MALPNSGVITGASVTGLTSPTYTLTADMAPDASNGKQGYVTAVGGTQAGVLVHSIADPFTATVTRCRNPQILGQVNPSTGLLRARPAANISSILFRKGVLPLANNPYGIDSVKVIITSIAGSEVADAPNKKALYSFAFGYLWANVDGIVTMVTANSI